ncbi:MAG: hypothetical protein DRN91_07995, partial [Candidatus Alkanophagales archaeon]
SGKAHKDIEMQRSSANYKGHDGNLDELETYRAVQRIFVGVTSYMRMSMQPSVGHVPLQPSFEVLAENTAMSRR